MKIKRYIIIFIILLIFVICSLFSLKNNQYLENIVLFNLYENSDNKIIFNIGSQYMQHKSINLYNTLFGNGLINKKIAPGTRGEFEIIIKSSCDAEYQIIFESKNNKPQNLLFNIKNVTEKYNEIEKLEKSLKGIAEAEKVTNYTIQWIWEYETNDYNNIQDTIDAKNIDKYNFDIIILSNPI